MRQKGIVATCEHEPLEVTREWFCLHMCVPEHLVAAAASNHFYDVSVKAQIENGRGTSGTEVSVIDALGFKSQVWPAEIYGSLESL